MHRLWSIPLLILSALVFRIAVAQSHTHEEEVVRSTYGAVSFVCSLRPVAQAATHELQGDKISARETNKEIADATPIFEISHMKTGKIASIASEQWNTRFSLPVGGKKILEGHLGGRYYTTETTKTQWKEATVEWASDSSFTPDRIADINKITVGQAMALSDSWAVPATYDRYATFDVTLTYRGETAGPYTASFFFGQDKQGREVVAPQDAFGAGQMLWSILGEDLYPAELIKSNLGAQASFKEWLRNNVSDSTCSLARADLCCTGNKCMLPKMLWPQFPLPTELERDASP
jgi:hypothetical protein